MPSLVLASASPARARLLRAAGLDIAVAPVGVDEDAIKQSLAQERASADDVATILAETKAERGSMRAPGELAWLAAHDDDPFARYEALQQLMLDTLVAAVSGERTDPQAVIDAVAQTLTGRSGDPAFVAEAVLLPSEAFIGDQMVIVDPDAIRRERSALQAAIGRALESDWRAILADSERTFPLPDLALLFEVPADVGLARVHARGGPAEPAFERADYLARVAAIFAAIERDYVVRIDATGAPEAVAAAAKRAQGN